MQKTLHFLLFLWVTRLSAAALPVSAAAVTERAAVEWQDCALRTSDGSAYTTAECAGLEVAENSGAPDSRQIELSIARLPHSGRGTPGAPLFFIAGGPGQSALKSFPLLAPHFERINQERDIVLVDQRGTGGSNALGCGDLGEQEGLPEQAEIVRQIRTCLRQLPGDPRFYTTWHAVQDLEKVRQELGYAQVSLYGVSYGTRVAQAFMREFPERVKAVVLDGVVPADEVLGSSHGRNLDAALALIFASCAESHACGEAFSEPESQLHAILREVEKQPLDLVLTHPTTGAEVTFLLDRFTLSSAVRLLAYAPETVSILPLLIHDAFAEQNYAPLAAQALIILESLEGQLTKGMELAVICSEDAPRMSVGREPAEESVLGNRLTELIIQQCAAWPRGEVPIAYSTPLSSDLPVLLLSGEWDPVTPPQFAEQVATGLSNSQHLVAPAQGHNVLPRGCAARLVREFLKDPDPARIDGKCLQELGPPPFFVSHTGPAA